ncbi:hypothetical protein FACS18947_0930 [Bacteroidia bacterium]|nr:hypothetical protein FACS18947_0930 [Bacteroidia bacterium]
MEEDRLLEEIRKSADPIEAPESLQPDSMKEKLTERGKKTYHGLVYRIGGTAAAVLVFAVLLTTVVKYRIGTGDRNTDVTMQQETAAENTDSMSAKDAESAKNVESAEVTGDLNESVTEEMPIDEGTLKELYYPAKNYDEVIEQLSATNWAKVVPEEDGMIGPVPEMVTQSVNDSAESAVQEGSTDVAKGDSTASNSGGSTQNHSATNLQVEGVDEGDIVKTDGNYLYIIARNRVVRIIEINGKEMKEIAVVQMENSNGEEEVIEIYLTGKTLNVITQSYANSLEQTDNETYYMDYRAITTLYTYSLANPEKPKCTGKVSQDGNYHTSRKVNGYVYLFTSFYPTGIRPLDDVARGTASETVIPYVNEKMVAASDIYLPVEPYGGVGYTVMSSVSMKVPDKVTDQKVILQNAGQFTITTENIYIQNSNWSQGGDQTGIAKFHFENGKITGVGAGNVPGTITDTFAINEYNGFLRVLTTVWSSNGGSSPSMGQSNYVTILDQKMNQTGQIRDLAQGETIYSARFMGDIGYFVTYRNMDPLFSVDLSDPSNPKVLGELKITGFSEYLHFYDKNKLLGIGWETDPDNGARLGMKLSMFDISDPADVKEIDKTVIKNIDAFPGETNYKALLLDPQENIIGLGTASWGSGSEIYSYMVFAYQAGKGFVNQLTYVFSSFKMDGYYQGFGNERGVFVGDTFYVVRDDQVVAFDRKDRYRRIGTLVF